jgi:putative oxidoreductase
VPVASLLGLAGALELVGGSMLMFGVFTQPVAFVLSGEMAVAYFMAHASKGDPLMPLLNEGEPAVLFCFIFLFLAAAGAGAWSIDAQRSRWWRR